MADCRTDDREYSTFTVIALLIALVIGLLTLFGTIIDITNIYFPLLLRSSETENNKNLDKSEIKKVAQTSQGAALQGTWIQVLLSFSVITNGRRLLSTHQPPGSIPVISGLRFLTMSWIVVGHTLFLLLSGHTSNVPEGIHRTQQYRIVDTLLSMPFGVDTFFTISGLLVSYLTIKRVMEKGLNFDWKHFFLHRYLRLTPTMMITFVLVQGLQQFFVSGTVAPTIQPNDRKNCEERWFNLPLYLNNMFGISLEKCCFLHTWSLAADFQFYLLSPFMMIPFYYNKIAGALSCLLFIVGQWIIAGIFSYQTDGRIGILGFTDDWFAYVYCPFYSRVAPFAVGIFTGYIMSVNNGRVQMSPRTVAIGWTLATITVCYLIFGFHGDYTLEAPSSLLVASIYFALSRTFWGAAVCWTIVACSSGYGGPVNAFLSWAPFTVLGRVTYIGYLIQMPVSTIIFENMEQLAILNMSSLIIFGTIDVIFTSLVSAVLVICVEFPMLNLEKVLLAKK